MDAEVVHRPGVRTLRIPSEGAKRAGHAFGKEEIENTLCLFLKVSSHLIPSSAQL